MSPERIGRYEIQQILGRGAAAVVFLARDPVIDRLVALKTLRLDLNPVESEEFRDRFLREARAAGRLSHPGLVTIFDAGEDREQGLLFIAMEYVEGKTLKAILQSGTQLAPGGVAELGRQMSEALDYAHRNGVVHRDIKPANVIITRGGEAKITDFGIARHGTPEHTLDGTILGSPSYMSPEQVSGGTVDGRSDLYSLGVVLYQLLTGRLPFTAASLAELSIKILQEPAPELAEARPDLAPTFGPIVRRCLAKAPEARYGSGAELARALATIAGAMPAREQDTGSAETTSEPPASAEPSALAAADEALSTTQKSRDIVAQAAAKAAGIPRPRTRRWRWVAVGLGAVLVLGGGAALLSLRSSGGPSGRWLPSVVAKDPGRAILETASSRLRSGDARGALEAAGQVPESSPSFAEAQSVLAEARRRLERESRPAAITASFLSPSSRGSVAFTLDGKPLDTVTWDFTRKVIFGITRSGSGQVHAQLAAAPGPHKLGVRLSDEKNGTLGATTFSQGFPPGSRWLLKVEPAKEKGKLRFSLRRTDGPGTAATPKPKP